MFYVFLSYKKYIHYDLPVPPESVNPPAFSECSPATHEYPSQISLQSQNLLGNESMDYFPYPQHNIKPSRPKCPRQVRKCFPSREGDQRQAYRED